MYNFKMALVLVSCEVYTGQFALKNCFCSNTVNEKEYAVEYRVM